VEGIKGSETSRILISSYEQEQALI